MNVLNAIRVFFLFAGILLFGTLVVLEHVDYQKAKEYEKRQAERGQRKTANPAPLIETNKAQPAKEAASNATDNADEKLSIDRNIAEYTRRIAHFNLWLVIATVILAVIGVYQSTQMKRTVTGAEDTAKRQLRGYVGIVAGEASQVMPEEVLVWVEFGNNGETPAHDVTAWINADVLGESPDESEFKRSDDEGKGWVLVRGATWRRHRSIKTQAIPSIRGGAKKRIWVWGGFEYVDSFGERCFGTFRYWNGRERARRTPSGVIEMFWPLIPDKKGNSATYGEKTAT